MKKAGPSRPMGEQRRVGAPSAARELETSSRARPHRHAWREPADLARVYQPDPTGQALSGISRWWTSMISAWGSASMP